MSEEGKPDISQEPFEENQQDIKEEDQPVEEEKPKPKKVKKNLRVGQTPEERSYTTKETLLAIASQAYKTNLQRNEISLEKDAERNRKKMTAEQRKVEKRQARLDRKKEKEEKIKQVALNRQMKKHTKKIKN